MKNKSKLRIVIVIGIVCTLLNLSYKYSNDRANYVLDKVKIGKKLRSEKIVEQVYMNIKKIDHLSRDIVLFTKNLKYYDCNTKKYLETTFKDIMIDNVYIESMYILVHNEDLEGSQLPFVYVYRDREESVVPLPSEEMKNFEYWKRDRYKTVQNEQNIIWSEPYFDKQSGKKIVSVIYPQKDEKGSVINTTCINISIENVRERIAKLYSENEGQVHIITEKGNIIYDQTYENIQDDKRSRSSNYLKLINEAIDCESSGNFNLIHIDGKSYVCLNNKIDFNNWCIMVINSATPMFKAKKSTLERYLLLTIVVNILLTITVIGIMKNKRANDKIKKIAFYSTVTQIPNRNYLNTYYKSVINDLIENDKTGSVMFLDMDNFKIVNDTLGHNCGDEFLKKSAKKFKSILKNEDEVFHMGGDEFVFLIQSIKGKEEAAMYAERILDVFKEPFTINEKEVTYVTASIGVVMVNEDGDNFEELLKNSDDAMYLAKEGGKNRYRFYSKERNI